MHTTPRTAPGLGLGLGLVLGLVLAVPAGCGEKDYCAVIFNKQIECASAEQKAVWESIKDMTLETCRAEQNRDPEVEASERQCAEKSSCDDFRECREALADAKYAAQVARDLEAALATGEKLEEVLSTCKFGDIKDAGVKTLCGSLFVRELATATAELAAIRDRGGDAKGKCFDLTLTAEKVSPEAKSEAEALCKEVEAARRASDAIAAAKKNLDTRAREVPFECGMAVRDLEKIGNEWSRARLAEVTRACFVELGNSILPALVPDMQFVCDYHVDQVYEAVQKYNLRDEALDPWIEKARPKCDGTMAAG